MIYLLLKRIVNLALFIFFKKIVITGKEHIPKEGPLIIASNHPNTLMDPLVLASLTPQRVGFVGNASIFINKLATAIFRYFHVIPIYRKEDVKPGDKQNNLGAFRECYDYFNKKGTLLIFPEGYSVYELKLREIKTGTARIALSYEDLKNFQGNLQIVTVALDYSDSIQFRSLLSVTINPPIIIGDYQKAFEKNELECIRKLTEDIRSNLAENIPQTTGKEQEDFLIKSHRFYTSYFELEDLYNNPKKSFELRNELSRELRTVEKTDRELYNKSQTKIKSFFNELHALDLTTGFFTENFLKKNKIVLSLKYLLQFLLLFPIYFFGLITNYLPYILPVKIFNALNIDIEYKSSVGMVAGLITFPLFYAINLIAFRYYVTQEIWHSILFLSLLPVSGFITLYYWTEVRRFIRVIRFYFISSTKKEQIVSLRKEILNQMQMVKNKLAS